jgi:hypothetical protein
MISVYGKFRYYGYEWMERADEKSAWAEKKSSRRRLVDEKSA